MKGLKMKNGKEMEKILLNDESYEQLMSSKIKKEFEDVTCKNSEKNDEIIKEIKDVPAQNLFSKNATYFVMNKRSKTHSYINGIQADGFLGSNNIMRKKLLSKESDYFVSGDCYIKFYSFKSF